jgi:ribosomal protein S18 acetylase RimI-like enzyme
MNGWPWSVEPKLNSPRRASADDIPAVARLLDRARQQIPLAAGFTVENIAVWLSRLQPPTHRVFVIEARAEIAAATVLEENEREAEVTYVVTSPDYQRQGHGRRLLQTAKDELSTAGVLTARVRPTNGPVIALLVSEGFVSDAALDERNWALPGGWRWYSWRAAG